MSSSHKLTRRGDFQFFFGLSMACLGILLCLSATPAWSQATSTATIAGLATDEQSAAVAGAEVRITDSATGSTLATVTNETARLYIKETSKALLFSDRRATGTFIFRSISTCWKRWPGRRLSLLRTRSFMMNLSGYIISCNRFYSP